MPVLFVNQCFTRPLVLVIQQLRKNYPINKVKFLIILFTGTIGFAIIQLLYIARAFTQIPKNMSKFPKNPYFKDGYIRLLWEDNNKMENQINEFFDGLVIGSENGYGGITDGEGENEEKEK